jgi:hypothetical protein
MKRYQVEDDAVVSVMAELRMLGMRTEALQDGARAAIAFAGEEGNLEESARLVALAYQGNYERLSRMIPALKNATSETEKAAIVNQFIAAKLQVQSGQVDTLSGAWKGFKLAVGEAVENAGRKLAADGTIQKGLEQITAMIEAATEAFGRWADQGGVQYMFANILGTMEQIRRKAWDIANIGMMAKLLLVPESALAHIRKLQAAGKPLNETQAGVLRDEEALQREMANRAAADKFIADLQKEPKKKAPVAKREDSAPIAGTDPGIATRAAEAAKAEAARAVEIANIEAVARAKIAETSKAHNAIIAQIEARKSIEEDAASKLANWKLDEEIKAADAAHAVRMSDIAEEASAAVAAALAVEGAKAGGGGGGGGADAVRAAMNEAKQAEDAVKRAADAQRDLDDAKKKSNEAVAAQRKIVADNEHAARLDASEKGASEALKRAEELKTKMGEGVLGTRDDRRNAERGDTKAEERRYTELLARQKRRGFTASREDKEFLEYMKGQRDAAQARADLAAVNQQRIDMANQAAVDAKLLLQQLIIQNNAVMNLSVQR